MIRMVATAEPPPKNKPAEASPALVSNVAGAFSLPASAAAGEAAMVDVAMDMAIGSGSSKGSSHRKTEEITQCKSITCQTVTFMQLSGSGSKHQSLCQPGEHIILFTLPQQTVRGRPSTGMNLLAKGSASHPTLTLCFSLLSDQPPSLSHLQLAQPLLWMHSEFQVWLQETQRSTKHSCEHRKQAPEWKTQCGGVRIKQ